MITLTEFAKHCYDIKWKGEDTHLRIEKQVGNDLFLACIKTHKVYNNWQNIIRDQSLLEAINKVREMFEAQELLNQDLET